MSSANLLHIDTAHLRASKETTMQEFDRDKQDEKSVWDDVSLALKQELGNDVYESWFAKMDFDAIEDGCAKTSVPTRFLKTWISSHYKDHLLSAFKAHIADVYRIEIYVRNAAMNNTQRHPEGLTIDQKGQFLLSKTDFPMTETNDKRGLTSYANADYDYRYTFSTFCASKTNQIAYNAARHLIDSKVDSYGFNPLCIHGTVGLGKTHLLQAIGQAGEARGKKALYLTAEKFMSSFVQAFKSHTALDYKDKLRNIDILLIDDLQFLTGRAITIEFCHTLNAMLDAGRQVVVAADRAPARLDNLDDRARSRLCGGLVAEIQVPDQGLRYEILKRRIELTQRAYPKFSIDEEVCQYIANNFSASGRDLEGALNRLLAQHQLTGSIITREVAEEALKDLIRIQDPKRIKIEDIQKIVARYYKISRNDLLSNRRTRTIVRPRQVAMYLSKVLTPRSFPEIGRRFGGRDHTTVLHAVRKIEEILIADTTLKSDIESLKSEIVC